MDFLDRERLEKWRSVQPSDIAAVSEIPEKTDPAFVALVAEKAPTFKSAGEIIDFVGSSAESFIELGRAGRLRFLAWVLGRKFDDSKDFMIALMSGNIEDEGDKGSADGSGEGLERVAPFFFSDLLAFAEALGPRMAAQIVDSRTLDIVTMAGAEASNEFEMKGQM